MEGMSSIKCVARITKECLKVIEGKQALCCCRSDFAVIRYNEFHLLRQVIRANWPGIYIPSLPAKKVIGNKDVRFIIERRYFIERFYLQLS